MIRVTLIEFAELGSQGQHRCLCFHTVPDRPITTRGAAGKDLQLLQLNFTRAAFTRIESKVPDDFSGFHHYDPCLEKFDLRVFARELPDRCREVESAKLYE